MKSIAILICTLLLVLPLAIEPATASDRADELTLAGTYVNPNAGPTVWSLTAEYLAAAGPFVIGPSFTVFDGADSDGSAIGLAAEWNTTGFSGLFFGGAVHKLTGDAGDTADYTAEARAGVKMGGGRGFFKAYVARTWAKGVSGDVEDPDNTHAVMALGLRF